MCVRSFHRNSRLLQRSMFLSLQMLLLVGVELGMAVKGLYLVTFVYPMPCITSDAQTQPT